MSDTLADRFAVTDLLYRYAELIDAGDFDGVGELLGRATFDGPQSGSATGAGQIAKVLDMTTRRYPEHGNTPRTRHLVLKAIVEVSFYRATARSTVCVVQHTETVPLQTVVVGRYHDSFGRDEGVWYFTERSVDIDMLGDVSAHLMVDPREFS